jgi:hypothetical protein
VEDELDLAFVQKPQFVGKIEIQGHQQPIRLRGGIRLLELPARRLLEHLHPASVLESEIPEVVAVRAHEKPPVRQRGHGSVGDLADFRRPLERQVVMDVLGGGVCRGRANHPDEQGSFDLQFHQKGLGFRVLTLWVGCFHISAVFKLL